MKADYLDMAQTFEKTRSIIAEKGWCTGAWQNEKGEVCLEGALMMALDIPFPSVTDLDEMARSISTAELIAEVDPLAGPRANLNNTSAFRALRKFLLDSDLVTDKGVNMNSEVYRFNDKDANRDDATVDHVNSALDRIISIFYHRSGHGD